MRQPVEPARLDDMKYKGEPTDAVFTMAISSWGDIQIELIKTDSDAPSLYAGEYAVRDSLAPCLRVRGVHR